MKDLIKRLANELAKETWDGNPLVIEALRAIEDEHGSAVTFEQLYGLHTLTGVDFSEKSIMNTWGTEYENCQVVNFVLDGVTYSAIEDPEDGYRSSMREIRVVNHGIANPFPSIQVIAVEMRNCGRGDCMGIDFYDIANGKLVLSVGTNNTDDYYPSFVADFNPKNMSTNDAPK